MSLCSSGFTEKRTRVLTSFKLHPWKLHEEELLVPLLPVHVLLLLFVKVPLFLQEALPDLPHLLAVPVLLAHLFQDGQRLGQLGPAVPGVAVLGGATHNVEALQHVHYVVDAPAFHICGSKQINWLHRQLSYRDSAVGHRFFSLHWRHTQLGGNVIQADVIVLCRIWIIWVAGEELMTEQTQALLFPADPSF